MLVDDTFLLPMRGLLWVLKQVHRAVMEEREGEAQACTTRLTELYMMLEAGQITEAEFDSAEKELLDRIERLEAARSGSAESEGSDDGDDEGQDEDEDGDEEDDEDDEEDDEEEDEEEEDEEEEDDDDDDDDDDEDDIDEDEEPGELEDSSEGRDTAQGKE